MNQKTFEQACIKAATMIAVDAGHAEYWQGYRRGVRRAHFGEQFGTKAEHDLWSSMADEPGDSNRRERGRGYLDGLATK